MTRAYDIVVVGGGAAGAMAAIRAGVLGKKVALVERNKSIGAKILLTGKGRCNLTNTAPIDTFIKNFGRQGKFLRSAFWAFSNEDLMDFLQQRGLQTKVERQGRVFPANDSARTVVDTLKRCLKENGVEVLCDTRLSDIRLSGDAFRLSMENNGHLEASRVVLATGGASYKATGSTGDGFAIARSCGHTVTRLTPGLVPLKTKETWVKDLQGLGLENIRLRFEASGGKKLVSEIGELMFTHFGVSGPLVLDLSADVLAMLDEASGRPEVRLRIDLKPALSREKLEERLLRELKASGASQIKSILRNYLPKRLIEVFISVSGVASGAVASQITQQQRKAILDLFKAFPLTITGSLELEEAMVTGGGVSTGEIDPRTMASRRVKGLYFAGEIIDGCASSGGYNLQQAFSTGYLAGESAAKSLG